MHPTGRQWRVIYAAAAIVCAALALTAGSDASAWHAGAVILIVGALILWRLFEP
jgi:fatty acid desaturase